MYQQTGLETVKNTFLLVYLLFYMLPGCHTTPNLATHPLTSLQLELLSPMNRTVQPMSQEMLTAIDAHIVLFTIH